MPLRHVDERTGKQRNPLAIQLRLVIVKIEGGREITLLSNDLGATATEIAALYKARWQVELFFKWLKQNLRIGHFLGTSRNAVVIQIMAALIAYLLLRLGAHRHDAAISLQAFARLMPATLLVRRPIALLLKPPQHPPPPNPVQLEIAYA